MGCDIHTRVEVYNNHGPVGKDEHRWVCADLFKLNPYFSGKTGEDEEKEYETVEVFGGRNYTAFTQLAGVRDYTGDFEPIQRGRGVPEDACEKTKADYAYWDCDAHSAGFVTLAEVIEFRKNLKPTKFSGYIDQAGRDALENGETPRSWCQGTNVQGYTFAEWFDEVDPLSELEEQLRLRLHETGMAWTADNEVEQANNIRLVFWFDN